jgi:hypothetical protein
LTFIELRFDDAQMDSDKHGAKRDIPPPQGLTPPTPELRALLTELAETLRVTRASIDDLATDLAAERWITPGNSCPRWRI